MNDIMKEMDKVMLEMYGKPLDELPADEVALKIYNMTPDELPVVSQPTPEEWKELMGDEEVIYPPTQEEIHAKLGMMATPVLEYMRAEQPALLHSMECMGTLLPFVQHRVDEAREMMDTLEESHYKAMKKQNPNPSWMENYQMRQQARDMAMEVVREEILMKPYTTEEISLKSLKEHN